MMALNPNNMKKNNSKSSLNNTYVQYGCGHSAPEQWINFDSSPTLRLERLPVFGSMIKKNSNPFPSNVRYGSIIRGLPIKGGSSDGVYASHVLEHLTRHDFEIAIENTYRMLRSGGIFRLVVPDLEMKAYRYLEKLRSGEQAANDWFMKATYLGREHPFAGIGRKITYLFGGSAHLWMWDFPSIESALMKVGFVNIRRCSLGDSGDPMFSFVEDFGRFFDVEENLPELAVHSVKP